MGIEREKGQQMEIKIKRLTDTATIPTRESSSAAGYDLYADIADPVTIKPHETAKISTGIALEIPEGYFGGIAARSGLSAKEGLRPANCYGIIDSDYRGPIIVALHNDSGMERTVVPQERIGQIIIQPYLNVSFCETDELSETVRGAGGFGSTGK
jgi:dUTP pyrophosphatase